MVDKIFCRLKLRSDKRDALVGRLNRSSGIPEIFGGHSHGLVKPAIVFRQCLDGVRQERQKLAALVEDLREIGHRFTGRVTGPTLPDGEPAGLWWPCATGIGASLMVRCSQSVECG